MDDSTIRLWREFKQICDGEAVDYVEGLGLGASPTARRWAAVGKFFDKPEAQLIFLTGFLALHKFAAGSKGRGRRKIPELQTKDARRAFRLWQIANLAPRSIKNEASNRELIELAKMVDAAMHDENGEPHLFPSSTSDSVLEQSVSRGRKTLGIEGYWHSTLCEKINDK